MIRFLLYFLNLLIAVVVGWLLTRAIQRLFSASPVRRSPGDSATVSGKTVRDPVCGTFVSIELSHHLNEGGQTLHFCSRECLERYQKKVAGH